MTRKAWTREDLEILENGYKERIPVEEIANRLNRSTATTLQKACKLGFPKKYPKTRPDLTGQKFGHLTVLAQVGIDDYGHMLYECECDCEEKKRIVTTDSNLRNNHVKSCGHLRADACRNNFKRYNQYDLSGEYGIGYTKNGEFLFDLEDYDKIKDFCWNIGTDGYVETKFKKEEITLHRLVLGICGKEEYENIDVDHIHGRESRHDNRKSNLRLATRTQNNMNKGLQRNNTSGVTGVYYDENASLWVAQMGLNGRNIHLGRYQLKEDAVKARKEAEEKYFGEWSYDNSQSA